MLSFLLNVFLNVTYGTNWTYVTYGTNWSFTSYLSHWSYYSFPQFAHQAATLAVNLLVQTTLVLAVGLIAAWNIRRRGAALQSCVLRMTLVATLFCPIASWLLYATGVSGFRIELTLAEPAVEIVVPTAPPISSIKPNIPEIAAIPPAMSEAPKMQESLEMPSIGRHRFDTPATSFPVETIEIPIANETSTSVPGLPEESIQELKTPTARMRLLYLAICGFWLCASVLLLFRLFVANLMMEGLRRKSRPAPQNVVCDCQDIARQMSVDAPPVLVNECLSSPCLLGWIRPAVMIPAKLHPISADVLAHELAHLRRHDCFWSLLGHVATAMLPWQPLVWLLNRRMEQAADNVCDDYVVAHNFDRISYARELITIAERFPGTWSSATAAVGIADFQSCLGSRVQRILDGSRTLSLRTGWKNLILVVVAAFVGTIVAGFLGAARNAHNDSDFVQLDHAGEAIAPNSDEDATTRSDVSNDKTSNTDVSANSTAANEISVKGVVLKPDGTAAAGATVRMGAPRFVDRWPTLEQLATRETTTVVADENGRFEIRVRPTELDQKLNGNDRQPPSTLMPIAASLKGFGPTWLDLEGVEPDKPITLGLVEDYVVRCQIVDLEGSPVRRTTVALNRIDRLKDENLTGFLSSINDGSFNIAFIQPWNVRKSIGLWEVGPSLIGLPEHVNTDNEGWLEIHGLGKDRLVHLAINGGDFEYRIISVASRNIETIQPVGIQKRRSIDDPIYGAPCRIPVAPTRAIEGIVVDAATGEPLAGVAIGVGRRFEMESALPVKTMSNAAGRFRLMGLAKKSESQLKVIPNEDQPYFGRTIEVPETAGTESVEMKITLHRGLWIKGRVTNKMTHEPIAGVHLHYYPLLSNDFARRLAKSDQDGDLDPDGNRYQSGLDGSYRLLGLPGPAVVGAEHQLMRFRVGVGLDEIKAPRDPETSELLTWEQMNGPSVKNSFVVQEINPGADERETRLNLELDPGFSVKIRVIDDAGIPVKGVKVWPGTRWNEGVQEDVDYGVRIVENLGSSEKRIVYAYHEKRDLGAMINLEPPYNAEREFTVLLRPMAKLAGRLLDVGEPMRGVTIDCSVKTKHGSMQILSAWSSDQDGRFRFPVMPGHEYKLHVRDGGAPEFYAELEQPLTFSPGEVKDLGDLELKGHVFQPAKANLPAAKAEANKTGMKALPNGGSKSIAQTNPKEAASRSNETDAGEKLSQRPHDAELASVITVTGVVLKPDGTPSAGATIRSAARVWAMIEPILPAGFVPKMNESKTDSDGKFSIAVSTQPFGELKNLDERWLDIWKETQIAASLPGFGPAWVAYKEVEPGKPLVLRLVEDLPIRGQIVDLEGNPVARTIVKINSVSASKGEDLTAWLASVNAGEPPWTLVEHAPLEPEGRLMNLPASVTTDEKGWLEIRGLGKERLVELIFEDENVAHKSVRVVSRDIQPTKRVISLPPFEATEPVFGNNFRFAVPPSRPIEGIVVDAKTGEPLPGVLVESEKLAGIPYSDNRILKTVSDARGRFRLLGMPKAGGNRLMIEPNDDQPYLIREYNVPNPPGIEPIVMRIELHRGVWIKGRVTDKRTHEPVAGVRLFYFPFRTNEFAQKLPEYDRNGQPDGYQYRYTSDREGHYSLVGLPGPAIVGAQSILNSYRPGVGYSEITGPKDNDGTFLTWPNPLIPSPHWPSLVREINPQADEQEIRLDLELDPGVPATLRIIDEQNNLVTGATIFGLVINSFTPESKEAVKSIAGLGPEETRDLIVRHDHRKIGAVLQLNPPHVAGREVTIQLQPYATIKGRLLNAGDPMPGITIDPQLVSSSNRSHSLQKITTDANGRFEGTLLTGSQYDLIAEGVGLEDRIITVATKLAVAAGETIDLGDLMLGKNRKFEPVKVARKIYEVNVDPRKDPQLQFAGSVVDPDGKPVGNAKIYAGGWQWGVFPQRSADLLTTTDQSGRFQFTVPSADAKQWEFRHVYAVVDGFGFAAIPARNLEAKGTLKAGLSLEAVWINSSDGTEEAETVLRLIPDDTPITGRIVNTEGQTLSGIRVRVVEVWGNKQGSLDAWEKAAVEKTADYYSLRKQVPESLIGSVAPSIIPDGVSGDDGRFVLRGIGRDRIVKLIVSGPGFELAEFHARTRKGETIVVQHQSDSTSDRKEKYCGADFVHVCATSVPIVGRITDIETDKPIAGVRVGTGFVATRTSSGSRYLAATTDADGRFRLDGVSVDKRETLYVFPPKESLYLPVGKSVATNSGQSEVVRDFQLRSGIPLSGRAVNPVTGEPIPGHVTYYAFNSNQNIKKFPGFDNLGAPYERTADADGRFTIPVIPGTGLLTFDPKESSKYSRGQGADKIKESSETPMKGRMYLTVPQILTSVNTTAVQRVDLPEVARSADAIFQIQSGIDVSGKLVDPTGQPLIGAIAIREAGYGRVMSSPNAGTFEVRGFYPESPRTLGFYHPGQDLAAVFELKEVPSKPLTITLQPAGGVRGRLLDENAMPLGLYTLSGESIPDRDFSDNYQRLATNEDGRFEIRGLVPGRKYTVNGRSKSGSRGRVTTGTVLNDFAIDSAKIQDIGDVKLQPAMNKN